jgi:hypothetical protein
MCAESISLGVRRVGTVDLIFVIFGCNMFHHWALRGQIDVDALFCTITSLRNIISIQ